MNEINYVQGPRWLQPDGITADSFSELAEIGIAHIGKLGDNVEIVCGPISTGGLGNSEKNFEVFIAAIRAFKALGHNLFDQSPFEYGLGKLRQKWEEEHPEHTGYCMPILTEFYGVLFETGLIRTAWFIPGWESSFGAKWEHNEMLQREIAIRYLAPDWIEHLITGKEPIQPILLDHTRQSFPRATL